MSKTFHIFQLQGLTLWLLSGTDVSHFTWIVLSPWDLVKCKSHFSVFDGIIYYLSFFSHFSVFDGIIYYLSFFSNPFDFFDRLSIYLRSKDNFDYLGLMLGGGRYHIFPRVTICVITHVTTFLREFCTVSNALLLLAHYYIDHCMPYALSSIFFKKYIFLKKTDSNAW